MTGQMTAADLTAGDPLNVYVHIGPDGVHGLYCHTDRRLAVLLMCQSCRRDELLLARVIVRSKSEGEWGWKFDEAYDGSSGLSNGPRGTSLGPKFELDGVMAAGDQSRKSWLLGRRRTWIPADDDDGCGVAGFLGGQLPDEKSMHPALWSSIRSASQQQDLYDNMSGSSEDGYGYDDPPPFNSVGDDSATDSSSSSYSEPRSPRLAPPRHQIRAEAPPRLRD